MPKIPQDLQEGDELTFDAINAIFAELRRWQQLRGVGQIRVHNASGSAPPLVEGIFPATFLIRLTTNGDVDALHDWEEVIWDPEHAGGEALVTTGCKSDGSNIVDPAREVNGLACPKSDAVIPAWRNKRGQVTFRAVRYLGVADSAIAASATGTVSVYAAQSGTVVDTTLNVTALNWNSLTGVTSGHRVMITPVEAQWAIDYEEC